MIVLTKRQKDILKLLCLKEDFITLDFISKKFLVSKKSIQNDIIQIDLFLKEKNFNLIRKAGTGIYINEKEHLKYKLIKELENMQIRSFSKLERHVMIKTTLLCRPLCTFQDLAEICSVSKQTIINSFVEVVNEFKLENITVEKIQGTGLRLCGEEIDIRRYFIQLINENSDNQLVQITAYEQGRLNEYEKNIDLILHQIETSCMITFSNIKRLKIIIGYMLLRISNEHILPNDIVFNNLSQQQELLQIVDIISEFIKVENEKLYLSTIILSERINQLTDLSITSINNTHDEAYQIAMFLIESLQNMQPINQDDIQDTINGLTLHLRSAINRYRNNLQIKNELVEQIKLSVSLIYEFTSKELHKVEKKYNIEFDENEIAYITLYIASIYETSFKEISTVKVLLVCSFGLATSSMLKSRIIQSFPGFEILGPLSQNNAFSFLKKNNVDLIISTNEFEYSSTPVIKVNPLLNYENMEKIKNKLDQFSYSKMCSHFITSYASTTKITPTKHYIANYVMKDNIQIIDECSSWEDAIQLAAQPLLKKKLINQNYVDSMINAVNEYGTYMVMTPNTAYVHAGVNDGIFQNCTAILVIKKPVVFAYTNSKLVSNIVILGIKDKRENDLLNIAYIFEKEKNIKLLCSSDITKETIINMHD